MKKNILSIIVLFAALLMLSPLSSEAQSITRNKKQQTTKTTTKKSKQGSSSSNSGKSKKTNKTTSQQSSSHLNGLTQAQKDQIIRTAVDAMVWVEGGTFTLSAMPELGDSVTNNEKPSHIVTLSGYYISKYEVTQELWYAVMESNQGSFEGKSLLPMASVSWEDCQTFIRKLNKLSGKHFRLPTEAEWEYAARGGNLSRGYKYSGSNTLDNVAWNKNNSDNMPHPVGTKSPNELGLYDMSGNVHELCQDWYGEYRDSPQTNPTGPTDPTLGPFRVVRGGAWYDTWGCCVAIRDGFRQSSARYHIGLRIAASSL